MGSEVQMGKVFALPQLYLKLQWVHERSQSYHKRSQSYYRLSGVSSPYTVFWFVVTGTRHVISEGQRLTLSEGDLLVFPPQADIMKEKDDLETTFVTLTLGCEAKVGVFDFVTLYGFPKITRLPPSNELTRLLDLWRQLEKYTSRYESDLNNPNPGLEDHAHLPDKAQYSLYTQIYAMLTQWFSLMLELMLPHLPAHPSHIDQRVHQACTFIRSKLGEKIRLQEIAVHVALSESHLRTLFHKSLGLSPMEFVRKERLLRAKELLLSTDYGLKTIAETIGFDEQGQLSRAFRLAEGISPLEYRRMGRTLE
jgi:AraC family transcriptional regulator of arabinose operon